MHTAKAVFDGASVYQDMPYTPVTRWSNMGDWPNIRRQLLDQWGKITTDDIDNAHGDKHEIAVLIQRRYGVPARMVESYLTNFERTLPLSSQQKVRNVL